MTEIIRAANSGFCFGVRRAIKKTEEQIKENIEGRKILTMGQLIHNSLVTDKLAEKGVTIIDSLDEACADDIIIVRSHGEGMDFWQEAKRRDLNVVDTTCPFVGKIHRLVYEASSEGYNIVIVGNEDHPEVKGIKGWCAGKASVVDSAEKAGRLDGNDFFIVCQTTIKKELLESVLKELDSKGKRYRVNNTICSATAKRQKNCMMLASECDAMVIIGGRNSSNTQKLFEISKKMCNNTFFVEKIEDLPLQGLSKCNKIGVAAGASTPECVIKEVIATMSDHIMEKNEMNMLDLMDDIERSLRLPHVGEIVNGKVHQVTDKEIIVNMGCKKDGVIPKEEVTLEGDQTLTDLFKEGDDIQAKVIKTDDGDGVILLSKKKLEANEHWNEINEACESGQHINVKVVRAVNGGVIAAYKEVTGFIPMSQLSDKYVEKADEFIGQEMEVKVTRVDLRRNRAVFSHKAVLAEEKQKKNDAVWDSLHVDDIVEGTVMRFTDYGAFVDLGGIDGLLHISEISWGKLKHPKEVLKIGDRVKVMILSMNREKGKISLGLKQTTPEPWSVINENYETGQVVKGKVVQIKEYGAFVELEPGLDGLVHISEVANKRVSNIADELEIGQEVEAKILDIDTERKRISLSLKQVDKADEDAAGEPDEEEIADITAEEAETADAEPEAAEEPAEAAEEAEEK